MGLFVNGVDAMAMSLEMRKSVRQWETCLILILDPGIGSVNFKTKSDDAFVWHGMARYQPYRKDIAVPQVTDPTTTFTARFQVDFTDDGVLPEIKTGYRVWIPGTDLSGIEYPDPYISLYDHVVTSAANSSLAWQRTIETIVNSEARPNYHLEYDGTSFGWL